MVGDLFSKDMKKARAPLAERMRPRSFDEFLGQQDIVAPGSPLRQFAESHSGTLPSMIFWGPPGSGKTTLAHLIALETKHHFVFFSAVTSGIGEVRQIIKEAKLRLNDTGKNTILFIDEIHRFNKAQQDAFLPHVENGIITLIGATTENPSFEVISALLSRCQVYTLGRLDAEDIKRIIKTASEDAERGLGTLNLQIEDDALSTIVSFSDGDARKALNYLEVSAYSAKLSEKGARVVAKDTVTRAVQRKSLLYDKTGEEHFNLISALHKSLRGSDPQAGLYWLARMLEGGEDPLYIARRLVRFASEDIGLADPQSLALANAAKEAIHFLGMPEGNLALAQAVVYLATAPKSNALYTAYSQTVKAVRQTESEPVPLHIRNAPTQLMKDIGYGKDYRYPHDYENKYVAEDYLPEALKNEAWYKPGEFGFEKEIKRRMDYWKKLKEKARKDKNS